MKPTPLIFALALTLPAPSLLAADAPAAGSEMPGSAEDWVRYLSDFTRNADMLVDPKKFIAALHQVTEPSFLIAAFNAVLDPRSYNQSVVSAMDPKAYGNYARLMDPSVATRWMMTLMDPQFINAVTYTLTDPGKLMRWMMLPMDPRVTGAALNSLNPNTYARWGAAPFDPKLMGALTAPMNPNWYGGWAGTMANPQTYGPAWGNWMTTPYTGVPVMVPGMVPAR